MDTFSVGGTLQFAWDTFKKRPWFFILVTVIILIVSWVGSVISSAFGAHGIGFVIGYIISLVIDTFIGMGSFALYLKAHEDAASAHVSDLWHPKPFWKYLATSIIVGIIVVIGLILIIVPGIIAALMLMFATCIVVDRELGPIEALSESRRITKGHRLQLLGLIIAVAAINALGILCLVVGLLITLPFTFLALVHAYRLLEHHASEVAPAAAPAPAPAPTPNA